MPQFKNRTTLSIMNEPSPEGKAEPRRSAKSPVAKRALEKIRKVFDNLDSVAYLSACDRNDFLWYRDLYTKAIFAIDERIEKKEIVPLDLQDFPGSFHFPDYSINAAIYAGSFDPFQMTHLALALQYLSHPEAKASVAFIVPEGHENPNKPLKSDYQYRLDLLRMQVAEAFYPLVVPLDMGRNADTIEIFRRFIALFPCGKVSITHLIGSDALPIAASLLPLDLEIWKAEARSKNVVFTYDSFVVNRDSAPDPEPYIAELRKLGLSVNLDTRKLEAPSSSDFRKNGAFSIVFPTKAIISHLEVLFRYGLNRTWQEVKQPKDYGTVYNGESSGE